MFRVDEQRRIEGSPVHNLIAFDWAGMVGEVLYPSFLDLDITWLTGATAYETIGRHDDRILRLFSQRDPPRLP